MKYTRRPADFVSAAKVEDKCTSRLGGKWRLGVPGRDAIMSLTVWMKALKAKIEECGMDPVFRVTAADGKSETYF